MSDSSGRSFTLQRSQSVLDNPITEALLERGPGLDIIEDSDEQESCDSPARGKENYSSNSLERVGQRSGTLSGSSQHVDETTVKPSDVNVEFEDDIEEASSDRDDLDE